MSRPKGEEKVRLWIPVRLVPAVEALLAGAGLPSKPVKAPVARPTPAEPVVTEPAATAELPPWHQCQECLGMVPEKSYRGRIHKMSCSRYWA